MFFDRFKELCERNHVSCKKAVLDMGLSNSIATKWKKTGATPTGDTLNLISKYFGVSVSYLLSGDEEKSVYVEPGAAEELERLRDEERALLHVTRGMTAEQVRAMVEFAKMMRGNNADRGN